MIITISINNLKVEKEIPTSWDQVTFKQFLGLAKSGDDYVKVLSIITEINEDTIRKAKIINIEAIISALNFLKTPPEVVLPKTIIGYNIPKDLSFETIAQIQDLREYISKEQDPTLQLESYPLYCAIYACEQKHGEYSWKHAEEMAEEFMQAPCSEVLAIGNFTLLKLIGLNLNIAPSFRNHLTLMKRLRLVLSDWRMTSAFMARCFTWKKKRVISDQSY